MSHKREQLMISIGLWALEREESAYKTRLGQLRFLLLVNLFLVFANLILFDTYGINLAILLTSCVAVLTAINGLRPKGFKKIFITDENFYNHFTRSDNLHRFIVDSLGEAILYNLKLIEKDTKLYHITIWTTFIVVIATFINAIASIC